jgi:hypothetical protein
MSALDYQRNGVLDFRLGSFSTQRVEAAVPSMSAAPPIAVPLFLKGGDQLAERRAIGPDAVDEHDAWLGLLGHFSLLQSGRDDNSLDAGIGCFALGRKTKTL